MSKIDCLFKDSLTGLNPYEQKLSAKFHLQKQVTFAGNKKTPVYNWFYYKEGYARDFVWECLRELDIQPGSLVLDPFCGTGTTLLAAKQMGVDSVGFDILPLGVFVSKVKLEDDFILEDLRDEIRKITALKFGDSKEGLADIRFLDMRKAFSRYARKDLPFFRERILMVDDENTRNFLLLGLLSIVGEASNIKKDGGVLRIVKKKHLPPVRYLLKNRLKRMFKDLKRAEPAPPVSWRVEQADARMLPLEAESVDAVITSPPYLNFVDYTKLYALELSLLVSSSQDIMDLRKQSMRSHVGADSRGSSGEWDGLPRLLESISAFDSGDEKIPVVFEGYFKDLFQSISEVARVLKPGGVAVFVVGNSALPGVTVDVDLILAEMGESLGLSCEDIWVANVRWADVAGITRTRPVRESAVILRGR